MKKLENKGFTLVELLAVIVVLAIVMGLAVVGITSVLENTRKSAFSSDAKSFLQGAHNLVSSDQANALMGETTAYAPACGSSTYLPLELIPIEQGGKSPYGQLYSKGTATTKVATAPSKSYIKVEADAQCKMTYYIYLTDGVKSIGSQSSPVLEDNVQSSSVS